MILSRNRYILPAIRDDLKHKMVFVGGPRQIGKTTMALHLLGANSNKLPNTYLNWDIAAHRQAILRNELPQGKILVFDEIHKFARWRSLMKGFYDQYSSTRSALVTGSARLDHYRKGGDSLIGRYHYYRLHPYSLRELSTKPTATDLEQLLVFGGFPEPLASNSQRSWRRWQRERMARVVYDDLRDLEKVAELSFIELLIEALPTRIGSPLSLQAIREELQVSHDSIRRWLQILENLYVCFRIAPFGAPRIRAVKKEQKLYFWDWSQAPSGGPRFENFIAAQLLKYCHYIEDSEGYSMELRFLRDTDGREVDFVVVQDKAPLFAVECKTGERGVSKAARYFRERTKIPRFYQVHLGKRDFGDEYSDVRVIPVWRWINELKLP
ncbi:MAG: ATP-binding protein [Deltaproteobacteria bacterium]|nr:ATP-binding protein [Deltaproteobacteria bacterium]